MKLILSAFALFASLDAHASGCGWVTEYAVGPMIHAQEVTGRFTCGQSITDHHICSFTSDALPGVKLSAYGVRTRSLPPLDFDFPVKVETLAGMMWEACESGDPEPAFQRNGVYQRLFFGEVQFWDFTADGK